MKPVKQDTGPQHEVIQGVTSVNQTSGRPRKMPKVVQRRTSQQRKRQPCKSCGGR